jgi:hypothetical protein
MTALIWIALLALARWLALKFSLVINLLYVTALMAGALISGIHPLIAIPVWAILVGQALLCWYGLMEILTFNKDKLQWGLIGNEQPLPGIVNELPQIGSRFRPKWEARVFIVTRALINDNDTYTLWGKGTNQYLHYDAALETAELWISKRNEITAEYELELKMYLQTKYRITEANAKQAIASARQTYSR